MLSSDTVLDSAAVLAILNSGHSRIPVLKIPSPGQSAQPVDLCNHDMRERAHFLGVILVKELLLLDPGTGRTAGQMVKRPLLEITTNMPLFDVLTLMQACGRHMALVTGSEPSKCWAYMRKKEIYVAIPYFQVTIMWEIILALGWLSRGSDPTSINLWALPH